MDGVGSVCAAAPSSYSAWLLPTRSASATPVRLGCFFGCDISSSLFPSSLFSLLPSLFVDCMSFTFSR